MTATDGCDARSQSKGRGVPRRQTWDIRSRAPAQFLPGWIDEGHPEVTALSEQNMSRVPAPGLDLMCVPPPYWAPTTVQPGDTLDTMASDMAGDAHALRDVRSAVHDGPLQKHGHCCQRRHAERPRGTAAPSLSSGFVGPSG